MILKLSILPNSAKHSKGSVPYYMLPSFITLKSLYLTSQPAYLEKITSIQRSGYCLQKNRVFKAPTSPSSHNSDNRDHEDRLGSNEPPTRPLETLST